MTIRVVGELLDWVGHPAAAYLAHQLAYLHELLDGWSRTLATQNRSPSLRRARVLGSTSTLRGRPPPGHGARGLPRANYMGHLRTSICHADHAESVEVGNRAVSERSLALRPRLATGLP